ncbi:uncharacterized protein LOC116251477 [Nymphaea colorata]|uniref:Transcriptional coactivator Hfi1/Transcriptional adapter 1 n=1 Tax=Nymphaea colorata TaxID=210225 RepID=A0A5K1BNK9_9MAGN|nr:uncharacterized protein LOC116251477 [Nymphaea colorata]
MPPSQQHSRINLADLKAQIVKRLGPDKAQRYFSHLTRLLSQKISKVEFDKLCYLTIGRENLALHNQFIRSVLKNACHAKVPPPPPVQDATALVGGVAKTSQSPSFSAPNAVILSNGDIPGSPQKGRTLKRDRRPVDRPSPLGTIEKTEIVTAHRGDGKEETVPGVAENGDMYPYDLQRAAHHLQGLAEEPDNERSSPMLLPPIKRARLQKSTRDQFHVNNKGLTEVVIEEDVEPVPSDPFQCGSPICAPLGIPFCSASLGGARKGMIRSLSDLPSVSSYMSSVDGGELLDTETLKKKMEHIAEVEGLHGVTIDCANLLNNGLDAYLKRLIRTCIELAKARAGSEQTKAAIQKQHIYGKVAQGINGMWQNHLHNQTNNVSAEGIRSQSPISLLDFRVAMKLNPQQLGDDWPSLLEKISFRGFDEE